MDIFEDLTKVISTLSDLEKNTHKKAKHKQRHNLYDDELEQFIDLALADGELTPKEKNVLLKKAQAKGIDLDEFEMVIEARLANRKASQKSTQEGIKRQRRQKIISWLPYIVAGSIVLVLCILEWVYKYNDWGGFGVSIANVLTIIILGAIFGALIFFAEIFL